MNVANAITASYAEVGLGGKVALVLGASRGIGATAARALARAGAAVVLAARDARALDELAGDIRAVGGEALAVPTDAADPRSVDALVREAVTRLGGLDVALNNAGTTHIPAPFADLSLEDLDRSIAVNIRGLFVAMKLEIAAMLERGGGAIVNMASTAGLSGVRGMGAYCATKHALIGATRCAALDYASRAIRVNAVAPGPIRTDRIAALTDEQREPIVRAVPMARIGLPEEVAAAVVWLCSDAASFVTGTVLNVDGGRLAAGA